MLRSRGMSHAQTRLAMGAYLPDHAAAVGSNLRFSLMEQSTHKVSPGFPRAFVGTVGGRAEGPDP